MPNIRLPNSIHDLNGTRRKDRHGEAGSSLDDMDLGELPPPPHHIHEIGKIEWRRVVGILEPYGLLKATDYGVMIGYAILFVKLNTLDVEDIKAADYAQFRSYCNDLGLTPVSRSKVQVGGQQKTDDPFSKF